MVARLQLTLAAALGLVAIGLACVLLFGGKDPDADGLQISNGFAGAISPPGALAPDFRLTDEEGRPASLRALRGRVTVLTFLYTTCEDTCPIAASQILGALDDLGDAGKDVPALAVSVDPANDTPALARRFLNERRITGRMHFALGDRAQLAPVWKAYGIQPQGTAKDSTAYEHSARVVVIGKDGLQKVAFPLGELTPPALAHDLRRLLAE